MRPQTKININRKETRIFGAVYERVYDEISEILRNCEFLMLCYFKAFKVLKTFDFEVFLKIHCVHKNSKIKKLEK